MSFRARPLREEEQSAADKNQKQVRGGVAAEVEVLRTVRLVEKVADDSTERSRQDESRPKQRGS